LILQADTTNNNDTGLSFQPKHSGANMLWFGLVAIVLLALFCETRQGSVGNANVCISSNDEGDGAEVFIDRLKIGMLTHDSSGLGGTAFRFSLLPGRHLFVVKKPSYDDFSREIELRKELYLEVTLHRHTSTRLD
jgi:hypothetical protein